MQVTDAAVVAQVLAGDRDVFRILVERHSRSLYHLVYRMTGSSEDSEEIVQDTFLRAFKGLEKFELRANFGTWIYRIATNRTIDFLKSKKMSETQTYRIAEDPDPEDSREVQIAAAAPGPDRLAVSEQMKSRMAHALSLLSPAERVAFTMRHMEGRSIGEISKTLNLKSSAAKNSVFRAVQKLRQQLEPFASHAK
jgi:RNA polymerase sigma-70 factor (ECF subfamily)